MREINKVYVPVYTDLLRRPVYAKYFDARTIGTMYRILSAHIWRLDTKETSESGYRGTVFDTLSSEYENGNLVCYFDDKALAGMMGVTARYVRKLRTQLQDLGLIEARQVESGKAKYFYKLGEVIAKDDYGFLHEVLYMDKWLAQVQKIRGDKNTLAEFEKKLKSLSNESSESADNDVEEFSTGTLTKLHESIMGKSSSIFVPSSGTVVPESRNCSSSPESVENNDNKGKNEQFSANGNNMKYKISPSSKEEVHKKKKEGAKKNRGKDKIAVSSEEQLQPTLFDERPKSKNVFETIKLHLNSNLAKVHSAALKAIKISGDKETRDALNGFLSSLNVDVISTKDAEYWTKTWENIARARRKLTPGRDLSSSAFLYSWWMFHTLDVDKPSARKSPSKIRSVIASYVSNVTDSLDDILKTFASMRAHSQKKSTRLLFAQPSHLYKALETYFTYLKENGSKDVNNKRSNYNKSYRPTMTNREVPKKPIQYFNIDLVKAETELSEKLSKLYASGIECQEYVFGREFEPPEDIIEWDVNKHIEYLEAGKYTPSFSTVTPTGIMLKLAALGYLDSLFFLPLPKYRKLSEKVMNVPYDCWEHVAWKASSDYYNDSKREYDKALPKGEEFAKLRVWCLLNRYADRTIAGGGFIHQWNMFDPEMSKPCTEEEKAVYKEYLKKVKEGTEG